MGGSIANTVPLSKAILLLSNGILLFISLVIGLPSARYPPGPSMKSPWSILSSHNFHILLKREMRPVARRYSIVALDVKTGKIKWEHKTEFPTWCSPLVTNGLVFAGYVTSMGVPYNYSSDFGSPTETPQISSGILMALDSDTGKELWEFNVGAQVAIGGPSIGNGMLLVPQAAARLRTQAAISLPSGCQGAGRKI